MKKRFAHGSYGEVWLASHGNLPKAFSSVGENDSVLCNSSFEDINAINFGCSSSNSSQAYSLENNLVIMKRVMVERGAKIYLSGLLEKYFGEYFLMLLHAEEMCYQLEHQTLTSKNHHGVLRCCKRKYNLFCKHF